MTASTSSWLRFLSKPSVTATRVPEMGEPYANAFGRGSLDSMSLGLAMPLFWLSAVRVSWSFGLSACTSGFTL